MATLRGVGTLLSRHKVHYLSALRQLSSSSSLSAGYWNRDWQPGPLPRTPEERASAAKKFGLRPEDYDILSDGSAGDYPNLPIVSNQWKDPFEDYDFPGIKRNYGEPFHKDYEIIGYDQWDNTVQTRYTLSQMFLRFLMIAFGFAGITYLANDYPLFLPEMPKQFPFNELYLERGGDPAEEPDIKHYTFEAAEES